MRHLSPIEQRIAWTHFQRQTDKDVLMAMARWFCFRADGTVRPFTVAQLVLRSRISKRSVERGLERLEAAWWIEITAPRRRGSRQPTHYRIVLHRLATTDPDAQHVDQPPEWRMNGPDNRQRGGCADEWRMKNRPDFEKVADLSTTTTEVRTDPSAVVVDRTEVRQSGGQDGGQQRPEHRDVPAFLAWAVATYPQHAHGAHLVLDRERDGHLISGLLESYPLDRLQPMTVLCWTLESDGVPGSPAAWIARSDRSFRVLRYKAAFLERVVVGAQQLSFGPEIVLTKIEIADAERIRRMCYIGCPHDPKCPSYAACVREIALARHVS